MTADLILQRNHCVEGLHCSVFGRIPQCPLWKDGAGFGHWPLASAWVTDGNAL